MTLERPKLKKLTQVDVPASDCDYVDDEVQEVRELPSGDFSSRRDWALAYFALHPDATPSK